jgi:hypothetical protein
MLSVSEMLMAYGLFCPHAISAGLFSQKKQKGAKQPKSFSPFNSRVQVTWIPPRNMACHLHLYHIHRYMIQVLELCCRNFSKIFKISYVYIHVYT